MSFKQIWRNKRGRRTASVSFSNLPIAAVATTFTGRSVCPQMGNNSTVYCANTKQVIAITDVRMTSTAVQAYRNAGIGPRASII